MKISIDDIKNAKNSALLVKFDENVDGISTDGAIHAEIVFSAFGGCINAKGKIVANVKLTCDRCLKEFSQKIETDVDETYVLGRLNDGSSHEIELKDGDFVTDLCGEDEIDVDDLIYQSVILNIPNPSVCDINCNGGALVEKYTHKEESDPRLDVFKNMKIKKEE